MRLARDNPIRDGRCDMKPVTENRGTIGAGQEGEDMADHSKYPHRNSGAPSKPEVRYGYLPSNVLPHDSPKEPVTIGDMANMFGVTHRTLHFYEEKGLISASRVGLMRVYNQNDVGRMALINACREVGMPVAVIQELLEELNGAGSQLEAEAIFNDALIVRKRELTAALSTIRRQMQQIATLLSQDDDGAGQKPDDRDRIDLNDLERRCIGLMAEGYAPMRLARALDLKNDELAELEAAIIRKFDANNRFQAVAKAVLLGIVAS